jgi:hypothetical protein
VRHADLIDEPVDVGAAQGRLGAVEEERAVGDGDGVEFLRSSILETAFAPDHQVHDRLAAGLVDDPRQAGCQEVFDDRAQLDGHVAPFAIHLAAFGTDSLTEYGHLVLERGHFVLERPHLRFRAHLRVVELVEFDADARHKILHQVFQAIDAFDNGCHSLSLQSFPTLRYRSASQHKLIGFGACFNRRNHFRGSDLQSRRRRQWISAQPPSRLQAAPTG